MVTKDGHCWFSEQWTIDQARAVWPFSGKEPQRFIACWETLAQCRLAAGAALQWCLNKIFCMPSGSDNTAAEAGCNKLFTTSWSLSHFLRLIVRRATRTHEGYCYLVPADPPAGTGCLVF